MKVGLLGFGRWGQTLSRVLKFNTDVQLTSIYSRTQKKAIKKYIKMNNFFTDWKLLVKKKNFDVLIVALPPHVNFKIFDFIKRKKIPVLFEKPISTNLNEIQKMLNFAKKAKNCKFFVNYLDLYNLRFQQLLKKLNKVNKIEAKITSYAEPKNYLSSLWEYSPHFIAGLIKATGDTKPAIISVKKKIYNKNKEIFIIDLKFKKNKKVLDVTLKAGWFIKKQRLIILKNDKRRIFLYNGNIITRHKDIKNNNIYNPLYNSLKSFIVKSQDKKKYIEDLQLSYHVTKLIKKIENFKSLNKTN